MLEGKAKPTIAKHSILNVVTQEEFQEIVDGVQKGGHFWPFFIEWGKPIYCKSVPGTAHFRRDGASAC